MVFLYLEDMRRLPETAPSVHEHFSSGNFSIKDNLGKFIAVGGDQKLEESINLSSKCSDGNHRSCQAKAVCGSVGPHLSRNDDS